MEVEISSNMKFIKLYPRGREAMSRGNIGAFRSLISQSTAKTFLAHDHKVCVHNASMTWLLQGLNKADVPNSMSNLNHALLSHCCVIGCEVKTDKFIDYPRHNSQHNRKNWNDHLMTPKNLHFDNEQEIHTSFKKWQGKWLHARLGFANHLALIAHFHITQEMSAEVEVSIQDPTYLPWWYVMRGFRSVVL